MSNGESGGGFSGAGRAIEEHVRTLKTPIHNKIHTNIPWNNRNQRIAVGFCKVEAVYVTFEVSRVLVRTRTTSSC